MDIATAVAVIVSVPGVLALVNLVKSVVDLGKYAALLAFALGIGVNLAAYYTGAAYADANIFGVVCVGALAGLGASGIYDVTSPKA